MNSQNSAKGISIQSVSVPRTLLNVCGGMAVFKHVLCQLSCDSLCGKLMGSAVASQHVRISWIPINL